MSREFYVGAGGLLVLIGAVIAAIVMADGAASAHAALGVASLFAGLGFLLLLLGFRNPFDARHRVHVKRKLAPLNPLIGLGLIAFGVGTLHLFYNVLHVMPSIVLIAALLAIPGGVFVAASIFADACTRCDRALESQRLELAALPGGVLERQPSDGSRQVVVGFCPRCRDVAVCRSASKVVAVLHGERARPLVELAAKHRARDTKQRA